MVLDKQHRDELHTSGLSDETIDAAGIYSAEGDAVRKILGGQPKSGKWGRGMVFRFRDAKGAIEYARFKPDFPRRMRSPRKL